MFIKKLLFHSQIREAAGRSGEPLLNLGAARLFALRPVGIHHRVSAAGLFTRRCALLYHHPRPTGRAEQPGRAMFQALRCCFHLQAASFCLPPAAEARQQRQGRGRGRRWGARPLGPGGLHSQGAWLWSACAEQPLNSARPRHETRALPEPAPSSGSVVAGVAGQPAGSAGIAHHLARPAGWPSLNGGVRGFWFGGCGVSLRETGAVFGDRLPQSRSNKKRRV